MCKPVLCVSTLNGQKVIPPPHTQTDLGGAYDLFLQVCLLPTDFKPLFITTNITGTFCKRLVTLDALCNCVYAFTADNRNETGIKIEST